MRVLDSAQTRQCLPMGLAIESQVDAFTSEVEIPLRQQLAGSLFMPGRVGSSAGIKIVSTVPGNPVGLVLVLAEDGSPVGMVDGPTLTAVRTGAGCGLATRHLADTAASTLAMLGAGAMAFDQIAAITEVRDIGRILVWSRHAETARVLADRVGGEAVESADAAVAAADIVSTATPSTSPLFSADALSGGAHLNAIGAFRPDMIEIPPEVTGKAFVVVEDREAAAAEAGDLIVAGKEPDADLREILAGRRPPEGSLTFFKSVGVASQDMAAARFALQRAEESDIGSVV